MKRLSVLLLLISVVSCSPITPSSSKLVGQNVSQNLASNSDVLAGPSNGLLRASSSHDSKILNPIFLSQSEYRKKPDLYFKTDRLVSMPMRREQLVGFSKEGKFKFNLQNTLREMDQDSIRILFVIQDGIEIKDFVNIEEVILSLKFQTQSDENGEALDNAKIDGLLLSPSLDSKDPIVGSRADKILHYTDKIVIQYQYLDK